MIATEPFSPCEQRFRRTLCLGIAAVALVLAAVFTLDPRLDVEVSSVLRLCTGKTSEPHWCSDDASVQALRFSLLRLTILLSTAIPLLLLLNFRLKLWGTPELRRSQMIFAVLALVAGPVLVANLGLKENWGRARPRDVVEFGGAKQFTPALAPSTQCKSNCSFVSGEASAMFMPFFVGALLLARGRRGLIAAGALAGFGTGLIRMIQGGHFISDVLFAGVLMALSAVITYLLVFRLLPRFFGGLATARAVAVARSPIALRSPALFLDPIHPSGA